MTTIDTSKAPKWFPGETPEERVYWRAGYAIKPGIPHNGKLYVYTSERAAWLRREAVLATGDYIATSSSPEPTTKAEALSRARREGYHAVKVRDEQGNFVEEWTV